MASLPPFKITPPLLNSSNPWASTKEDLLALYSCPHTGAVTLRTSLLKGFPNDASIHQYTYFFAGTATSTAPPLGNITARNLRPKNEGETCSLNTLGYSPITFDEYLSILAEMKEDGSLVAAARASGHPSKPFIVSVSGSSFDIGSMLENIIAFSNKTELNLMMEINLSCPNIPNKPPPAYDGQALGEYITAVALAKSSVQSQRAGWKDVHVGIKTPPYTHAGEFNILIAALKASSSRSASPHPISFITSTNTLGSCLILDPAFSPALGSANDSGIGGMAGEALHPLALGNVRTVREMLDSSEYEDVKKISIIGIGGVSDAAGWRRMKSVGAAAVGVGTALGRKGVDVFRQISADLTKEEFVW